MWNAGFYVSKVSSTIQKLQRSLRGLPNLATGAATTARIQHEIQAAKEQIETLDHDLAQIQGRIEARHQLPDESNRDESTMIAEGSGFTNDIGKVSGSKRQPNEKRRDYLIRTGKITPFSKFEQAPKVSESLAEVMFDAELDDHSDDGDEDEGHSDNEDDEDESYEENDRSKRKGSKAKEPVSHRNLLAPGFADSDTSRASTPMKRERPVSGRAENSKRRKLQQKEEGNRAKDGSNAENGDFSTPIGSGDDYSPEDKSDARLRANSATGTEDSMSDGVDGSRSNIIPAKKKGKTKRRKADEEDENGGEEDDEDEDLADVDDGNEKFYQKRIQRWARRRKEARRKARAKTAGENPTTDMEANELNGENITEETKNQTDEEDEPEEAREECYQPHPTRPDADLGDGLRIPGDIYPSLFSYQKTGVRWLWELYTQQVGGIIGDEMGLGKTIQVISFLAGLHYSQKLTKPIVIVAPATVMKQWVNEFHRWWPALRVSILHSSGSGMMNVKRESQLDYELESRAYRGTGGKLTKAQKASKRIVDRVVQQGHVLVTTYSGLQTYAEFLIPVEWEYAVLDEGHKIRNPNAGITIFCKELRTSNRIILSGTPMQNNLTELWSLFDFVFPMRLGNLVTFRQQFEVPIKQGGYANASNLQVETAMKCAETLKDTVSPYLLQRFKVDVAADLPRKSERVLFCKLTKLQREAYETFLESEEMKAIHAGKRHALYGVDLLRKICNHPDLAEHKILSKKADYKYGSGSKSGKMQVVKALLEIWKRDGHKTLLFAQHRIMLDILEKFIRGFGGFRYRRMDGNTSIRDRQDMVDEFNRDPDLHVFLLTTKVGGLGVNLTGANRVIIYDPDWNPSTDVQARERAWRLGQKREVEIYRLMTAGTIEEKIYHRQIFKQFLTNKILRDPKQRQTFQLRDLHDLFSLGDASGNQDETETGMLFKGTEVRFQAAGKKEGEGRADEKEDGKVDGGGSGGMSSSPASVSLPPIVGISREEDYNTGTTPEVSVSTAMNVDSSSSVKSKDKSATPSTAKPDHLLNTIFSRSGVHSALEHDAIFAGNSGSGRPAKKKITADPAIIAAEARRVADEAARGLRRAANVAKTIPAGTPTWTGVVGTGGRPPEPQLRRPVAAAAIAAGNEISRNTGINPSQHTGVGRGRGRGQGQTGRGMPSSASILSNLAVRQNTRIPTAPSRPANHDTSASQSNNGNAATTTNSHENNNNHDSNNDNTDDNNDQSRSQSLLLQIRSFLLAHNGAVHTQMLVDHFSRFCGKDASRTAEFRELLRRVAVLEKRPGGTGAVGRSGRGKWVLKEEFRELDVDVDEDE